MSGTFELLTDDTGQFRVVLLSDHREILAASVPYTDKARAAVGIAEVREIAGTGLIVDRTRGELPTCRGGTVTGNAVWTPNDSAAGAAVT